MQERKAIRDDRLAAQAATVEASEMADQAQAAAEAAAKAIPAEMGHKLNASVMEVWHSVTDDLSKWDAEMAAAGTADVRVWVAVMTTALYKEKLADSTVLDVAEVGGALVATGAPQVDEDGALWVQVPESFPFAPASMD